MVNKQNEKIPTKTSDAVATNFYQPSDYKSSQEVEIGLAKTHEQVSDTYVEGTVDGNIAEFHGEDFEPKRKGFTEFEE